MFVFVIDKDGRPGHPTRRLDWVRKQLARRRARLIGGGASGKPPVLVLEDQVFDPSQTLERRFIVTLDTGFRSIGFAMCEVLPDGTLRALLMGTLTARTPEIRDGMDERRMYRRGRRFVRRANVKAKDHTPKHRPPRFESRRQRASGTLKHGVQTHLNLFAKLDRLAPLPKQQVLRGFEAITFDLRALLYGKPANGWGYQLSPVGKRVGEKTRAFIIRRDGGCIVCGSAEGLHGHHLRKRSRRGSNRAANQVALCGTCHGDVHAGLIPLPIEGGATWRDAGNVNAIAGVLRGLADREGFVPVSVADVVAARAALGLPKDHAWDAVAGAAALSGATRLEDAGAFWLELKQYRRHRRARIHAQRDRLYYCDGKIAARNRRKRTDQKDGSLAELRASMPMVIGALKVKPAVRLYAPNRNLAPAVAGEVWTTKGQRFIVEGTKNKGQYLHSGQLAGIVGKTYVSPTKCRRIVGNEGMVVTGFQLPTPNQERRADGERTALRAVRYPSPA